MRKYMHSERSYYIIVHRFYIIILVLTNDIHFRCSSAGIPSSIGDYTCMISSIMWEQVATADSLRGATHKTATPTSRTPTVRNIASGPSSITPERYRGSRSVVWWSQGHSSRWTVLDGDGDVQIWREGSMIKEPVKITTPTPAAAKLIMLPCTLYFCSWYSHHLHNKICCCACCEIK